MQVKSFKTWNKKHINTDYLNFIFKYYSKLYRARDIFILQMRKLQLKLTSNLNDWLGIETIKLGISEIKSGSRVGGCCMDMLPGPNWNYN